MTLSRWVRTHEATWQDICRIMAKVADAIQFAHKKGVIHRDLKPSNILVDEDGVPHVADFGLAVNADSQSELRGQVAGTLVYMSPEQLRGEVESIDGRTDLWSLGVTLYYLLVNQYPFGRDPGQIAAWCSRVRTSRCVNITRRCPKRLTQSWLAAWPSGPRIASGPLMIWPKPSGNSPMAVADNRVGGMSPPFRQSSCSALGIARRSQSI